MKNLKWIMYDRSDREERVSVCKSKEEAVEVAKNEYLGLTKTDLQHNREIIACLANMDETGNFAEIEVDGYIQIDSDLYDIAWTSIETEG